MFAHGVSDRDEATRRMFALHDQMVTKYEAELHEARNELAALKHENASLLRKFEQVDLDTARSHQAAAQYTSEIQALMNQQKETRELAQRLNKELRDITSERDNFQFMVEETKTKLLEYENRLLKSESATTVQVELETRIARQNAINNELQRDVTVLQESNRTLQVELASVRRTNAEHAKEKEDLELRIAEQQNRAEAEQEEIVRLRAEGMRLREQMQIMARQQADTLNKHLTCVEGKHRKHVSDLKDENIQRVNELTSLQARLAKSEWTVAVLERERSMAPSALSLTNGPGAPNPNQATIDIIETQQRTINDLTSRNNELTITLEKSEMTARRDGRQSRLDLEELRTKLEETSSRAATYRREADEAKASLDRQSEELSRVYNEVHSLKIQLDDCQKKKETEVFATRQILAISEEKHRGLSDEQNERIKSAERKLQRSVEAANEREGKLKQDIVHANDRYNAELLEVRKSRDDMSSIVKDLQGRLQQISTQYMEKERESAQLHFNVQKLMQGLEAHKYQIEGLNDKVLHGAAREQELRAQHHELLLRADALRAQLESTTKERDVAVADLGTLCGMLKSKPHRHRSAK
jgi:chromosome segregation ATPase